MAKSLPAGMPAQADARPERPSTRYTLDDLPSIVNEVEALGSVVKRVNDIAEAFHGRLESVEKVAAALDLTERQLPTEVIAGLSPGEIFLAALQGAIQSTITIHPSFPTLADNRQAFYVRTAVRVAELTLASVIERCPTKKKG